MILVSTTMGSMLIGSMLMLSTIMLSTIIDGGRTWPGRRSFIDRGSQ